MRFDQRFCARTALTAGLFAAAVSVFGLSPVHAQTKPTVPPASQAGTVVRQMSIDDAVAMALEQNLDLQVQRINPQANLGIGPPITDGFYYDFGVQDPFTPEDIKAIDKEMQRIIREGQRFVRRVVSDDEARAELAA